MTTTTPETSSPSNRFRHSAWLQRIATGITVVVLLFLGYEGAHWLFSGSHSEDDSAASDRDTASELATIVELTPEKIVAAEIQTEVLTSRLIRPTQTIPATVGFNEYEHVVLRASADCVVKELDARPGQWVAAGDHLAVLSSSQVGKARSAVAQKQDDLTLAQMQLDWAEETHANLDELMAFLSNQPSLDEVEARFKDRVLGTHRDDLISAYSNYVFAQQNMERASGNSGGRILPMRTVEERRSQLQVASAQFMGVLEETRFQSKRELALARKERNTAQRELEVAEENVRLLLGNFGRELTSDRLSEFAMTAPFAGQIGHIDAAPAARLQPGEPILEMGDSKTLWVTAHISQQAIGRLQIEPDEEVPVEIPAVSGKPLRANFRYVGAALSPTTLSVPLVAEIDNRDGKLRPGMTAWVEIPVGPARETLAVPEAAIQRHDNQAFVFVQRAPQTFARVDVQVGEVTNDWIEVAGQLSEGDEIVSSGAFFLKSELLLESED